MTRAKITAIRGGSHVSDICKAEEGEGDRVGVELDEAEGLGKGWDKEVIGGTQTEVA